MIVVKKLSSELQIELSAKFGDTVAYILGLEFNVFLVVKTDPVHE